MQDACQLRSRLGSHCVAAHAGLRPCGPVQGEESPCQPLLPAFQLVTQFAQPAGQSPAITAAGRFLVYQTILSIHGQAASMPLATRLESSKRCYWLCQTSGWNEWAGKPSGTLAFKSVLHLPSSAASVWPVSAAN